MLLNCCKVYGLGYIDNSNTSVKYLVLHGLYLNEEGKKFLPNNFVNL